MGTHDRNNNVCLLPKSDGTRKEPEVRCDLPGGGFSKGGGNFAELLCGESNGSNGLWTKEALSTKKKTKSCWVETVGSKKEGSLYTEKRGATVQASQ